MTRKLLALLTIIAGAAIFWMWHGTVRRYISHRSVAKRLLPSQLPPATEPFSDYRSQRPRSVHNLQLADLPKAYATASVDNGPAIIPRPVDAWPKAPPGFKVDLYADALANPRLIRTAPNGDLFLSESQAGQIKVLRGTTPDGRAKQIEVFASGLHKPFGIAFYPPGPNPQWVYVASTDAVVRFPYRNGDLRAQGPPQGIAKLPAGGFLRGGGHWTRDIAFSLDGKRMFVSVGSRSNDAELIYRPIEYHRADILEFTPDGSSEKVYAWGIRNAVGIAINPANNELWVSVNERDGLGDDVVPDYITHVQEGGFFGWPWWYMGPTQDPRHPGSHPELRDKVITPDVLLQPHNASLEMTFYNGGQFPIPYRGDIFAAQHGSWNRAVPTGYSVIRVPLHQSAHATGEYEEFLTGFITEKGQVWGRPVGVAVGKDGSLFVSDDGSRSIWRISYQPSNK